MRQSAKLIVGLAMLGATLAAPAKAADDAVVNEGTIASYGDPATALRRIGSMTRRGSPRGDRKSVV